MAGLLSGAWGLGTLKTKILVGVAALVALVSSAVWIDHNGYNRGAKEKENEIVAELSAQYEKQNAQLQTLMLEQKIRLEESQKRNIELAARLSQKTETVVTEVRERVIERPVTINGDCSVSYGVVELFNFAATQGTSTDSD